MPGILNINSNYDINTKKLLKRLSFEVGQVFLARVQDLDKLSGEILLKMLDGWQFSAKLEGQMGNLTEGLMKFQVDGFVDGKLQIKSINGDNVKNQSESSIETLLKENSLNLDKEDFPLLSKMVKHNISLTKENISNAKTFIDFIKKLNNSPQESEAFINKYLENKSISLASSKGQALKVVLGGFFNELKNMSPDDILTFVENNIELTEDNIKSFNRVFKESGKVFIDIKNINKAIIENKEFKVVDESKLLSKSQKLSNQEISKEVVSKEVINKEGINKEGINKEILYKDNEKSGTNLKDIVSKNSTNKNQVDNETKGIQIQNNSEENKEGEKLTLDKIKDGVKTSEKTINKGIEFKQDSLSEIAKHIKDEVSMKTDEMKNIIKSIIESKVDLKSDGYNNVLQMLDKSINDFKVFNSVSNQYYYLDLPVNVDNSEYKCKLMIKDERKKGKKIDSANVKIAASVSTVNMGIVDAYIKVNNFNMNVDIKCEEMWIKFLDKEKSRIINSLSNLEYNISVKFEKKDIEMDIVNCREFFEDASLGVIDKKV